MNDVTLMEKMAEVAPQHYNFLLKTAEEIKTSPYKDEIVEELNGLMKLALDWGALGRGALGTAGAVGVAAGTAALGGIAMSLAGDMYDAAKRGITKTRNYKQMMNANPELRDLPAKSVQKAFSVLHRFNPEFSGDPTVAGAWVKRQATFGEDSFGDVNQMKQLIDSRKSLADTKRLPNLPQMPDFAGKKLDLEKKKLDIDKTKADMPRAAQKHEWDAANAARQADKHEWDASSHSRQGQKHEWDAAETARRAEKHKWDIANADRNAEKHHWEINRYSNEETMRPILDEINMLRLEQMRRGKNQGGQGGQGGNTP